MFIYFDIETRPSQSEAVHSRIAETITPPGNISKAETIAAWEAEKKPALIKEAIAKTALDGSVGSICCIGCAVGEVPAIAKTSEDERGLISWFLEWAGAHVQAASNHYPVIVGHNVVNFDIRFMWQRAIILGIRMPPWFPRDPKPWGSDCFDTMTAFAGQRNTIGMDRLCLALGMEGKGDIDGSMIGDLWAAGEYDRITTYCSADVERTREIHRRMLVAYGEAA